MASKRTNTNTNTNVEETKAQRLQRKQPKLGIRDDDERKSRSSSRPSSSRSKTINKPSQNFYGGIIGNASQIMGNSTTHINIPAPVPTSSSSSSAGATVQTPGGKEHTEKNGGNLEKTTATTRTNNEGGNSNSNMGISLIQQLLHQFGQFQQAQLGKSKEGEYECKNIRAMFINNKFDTRFKPKSWDVEKRNAYDALKREGSEKDAFNMIDLFEAKLGIKVDYFENINSFRLNETIENFKDDCKSAENKHDGLVVIIGTHGGTEPSSLLMEDLEYAHLWRDIIFKFSREQFQGFLGPKIFLVNACREDKTNIQPPAIPPTFNSQLQTDCSSGGGKLNLEDILVGLSTNTMDFSYRTPDKGSLYLHFIYQVLSQELENGEETSNFKCLLDSQVSPKVAEYMRNDGNKQQIPVSISLLFKQFNFKKQT